MKKSAKELVNDITNFVNDFSINEKEFIEAMENEHRTLQQSFTRLCFKWIEHCASDEYRHDGRNEQTHKTSKFVFETYRLAMNEKYKTGDNPYTMSGSLMLI